MIETEQVIVTTSVPQINSQAVQLARSLSSVRLRLYL